MQKYETAINYITLGKDMEAAVEKVHVQCMQRLTSLAHYCVLEMMRLCSM